MSRFCSIHRDPKGWFISDNEDNRFRLPGGGILNLLWEIASKVLLITNDDCGANLSHALTTCKESSKKCKEMSSVLDYMADEYDKVIKDPFWIKLRMK